MLFSAGLVGDHIGHGSTARGNTLLHVTTRAAVGALGLAFLGLAASVPIGSAQPGWSPQEQEYVNRVQAAGINGDPGKMVEVARSVCRHTAEGASVDDMANTLAQGSSNVNGPDAITMDQAYGMVTTAQSTVCPGRQPNVRQPENCSDGMREIFAREQVSADVADLGLAMLRRPQIQPSAYTACALIADDPSEAFFAICNVGRSMIPAEWAYMAIEQLGKSVAQEDIERFGASAKQSWEQQCR